MADPAIIPGASGLIRRRIQRAVLRFHRMDFWKKDLIMQEYAFQAQSMIQILRLNLFPRLRAFLFIRTWDPTALSVYQTTGNVGALKGPSFEEINPEKMLDGYGYDRRNTMYRAGEEVHLNSSISFNRILVGWYQDPLIEPIEASNSWIMRDYQDLIAADVKAKVFKDTGKDEEAKNSREDLGAEVLLLQTNNIRLSVM